MDRYLFRKRLFSRFHSTALQIQLRKLTRANRKWTTICYKKYKLFRPTSLQGSAPLLFEIKPIRNYIKSTSDECDAENSSSTITNKMTTDFIGFIGIMRRIVNKEE